MERKYGVDPALALRLAECDGGNVTLGPNGEVLGSRESFRGRLTGIYYEEGEPPWRWYELADLTLKPEWHMEDTVWCEEGFIFLIDEQSPPRVSNEPPSLSSQGPAVREQESG